MSIRSASTFARCARKVGLGGNLITRHRVLDDVSLVVHHHGATMGRGFYLNAGLYFSELLEQPLTALDLETAFLYRTSIPTPHVDWRIEETPGLRRPFIQQDLEDLVVAGDRDALRGLLVDALQDVLGFVATHGNRQSVRRLKQEGRFRAILRNEV